MKVNIGDKVWFHSYRGVHSGVVVDVMEKMHPPSIACVNNRDSFQSIEIDSRKMFLTPQEATLSLAEKKQQEAAKLLSEAADLFKRAGGMKQDATEAARE